jgi:hypothetical protein
MTKKKWLDFRSSGPQCITCGGSAFYMGCDSHVDKYPVLTQKNLIRIPNCKKCFLECAHCESKLSIPQYLEDFQKPRIPNKKKRKVKEPEIKMNFLDKLQQANLTELRDLNIFRDCTKEVLDMIFCFDIGTQLAIDDLEKKLLKLELDSNLGAIKSSNDRLSRVYFTLLMIRASGLSSYEKEIMEAEIKRIYSLSPKEDRDSILELLKSITKKK